ncbi:P-loop containing nucleoside triphosphate hydrolase [Pseudocohnilembus persalinus]|uniref:p-loop containing nucleoside triphosphate hydrolase n=1 Tax=Pseudocohnilembus persalinus TaxID=266149 RepID=A0A0V0QWX2_PSEPJ|nr:P-loop containing nucleoside triphosphate hydrolase [Pseudocohnilembus persalinus]|eukprot:KRX06738.1 P-loop containing nucleoside triphosphate hydrolase [Pseudocohnilembus persalinus]
MILGFIIVGLGAAYQLIYPKIFKKTIIIQQQDPLFKAFISFMIDKQYINDDYLKVALATIEYKNKNADRHNVHDQNLFEKQEHLKSKPRVNYVPTQETKPFTYKGQQLYIYQHFDFRTYQRSLLVSTYYNFKILKELVNEALDYNLFKEKDMTQIYAVQYGQQWQKIFVKTPRTVDSVILPKKTTDFLIEDVKKFYSREKWYYSKGVPFRRGYLLYGPPGAGKTSFVYALAGLLNMNICVVSLNSQHMTDENLQNLLQCTPPKSIILMEDVDTLYDHRTQLNRSQVTFSGFLNCIDGILAQEGHVLFMSTNHREKLDSALIRPGRADVHIKLDHADKYQIEKLFFNLFSENEGVEIAAKKFAEKIPEKTISMAMLQSHFMKYIDDMQQAVENYQEVIDNMAEQGDYEEQKKNKKNAQIKKSKLDGGSEE